MREFQGYEASEKNASCAIVQGLPIRPAAPTASSLQTNHSGADLLCVLSPCCQRWALGGIQALFLRPRCFWHLEEITDGKLQSWGLKLSISAISRHPTDLQPPPRVSRDCSWYVLHVHCISITRLYREGNEVTAPGRTGPWGWGGGP